MKYNLHRIESEDVIIHTEHTYSQNASRKCRDIFNKMVEDKIIVGSFSEDEWVANSDIRKSIINFSFDYKKYYMHIGKEFCISKETMVDMLKCFCIYCSGEYIFTTINSLKIKVIKEFLQKWGDADYEVSSESLYAIKEFLEFINTSQNQIDKVVNSINTFKYNRSGARKLKPLINYLVLENEVNRLYRTDIDDEVFKKWFPIFFWVNITFILPLRATEMLVTPYDCLKRENGKCFLTVRRTLLKKKTRKVYYKVENDYKLYSYEIPPNWPITILEKYIRITASQDRRFLFEYNRWMINDMLTLGAFNELIREFMEKNIIGNPQYDFVLYASGIHEFSYVSAGDSRPIAITNLYFQNNGVDVVRQLAGHENIKTTAGYYTNITETIQASAIMKYLKRINNPSERMSHIKSESVLSTGKPICLSNKKNYIEDCVEQNHCFECMGCKYYKPTETELDNYLKEEKKELEENSKKALEILSSVANLKYPEKSLEEVLLKIQTHASRYSEACDINMEEVGERWRKHPSSLKMYY